MKKTCFEHTDIKKIKAKRKMYIHKHISIKISNLKLYDFVQIEAFK